MRRAPQPQPGHAAGAHQAGRCARAPQPQPGHAAGAPSGPADRARGAAAAAGAPQPSAAAAAAAASFRSTLRFQHQRADRAPGRQLREREWDRPGRRSSRRSGRRNAGRTSCRSGRRLDDRSRRPALPMFDRQAVRRDRPGLEWRRTSVPPFADASVGSGTSSTASSSRLSTASSAAHLERAGVEQRLQRPDPAAPQRQLRNVAWCSAAPRPAATGRPTPPENSARPIQARASRCRGLPSLASADRPRTASSDPSARRACDRRRSGADVLIAGYPPMVRRARARSRVSGLVGRAGLGCRCRLTCHERRAGPARTVVPVVGARQPRLLCLRGPLTALGARASSNHGG